MATAFATTSTLRAGVSFNGVGLHGGQPVTLQLVPASPGHGILFRRTDLAPGSGDIPARFDHVVDTRLCTRLGNAHGASVGTVEHLMAALAGCGITDVLVCVSGPEVPIMDGSAAPFVAGILRAGVVSTGRPCSAIRILAPVAVEQDDKRAELRPAGRFEMEFSIRFDDPAIGAQSHAMPLTGSAFVEELGDTRTFGHLSDVEQLWAMGLARGGSLQNAVVVDRGRVLNPDGLRRQDEFIRHKMLDAVGDLALAGAPIIGRFASHKGGHETTNRLLRALFARPDAWAWERLRQDQWFGGVTRLPAPAREVGALAG